MVVFSSDPVTHPPDIFIVEVGTGERDKERKSWYRASTVQQ